MAAAAAAIAAASNEDFKAHRRCNPTPLKHGTEGGWVAQLWARDCVGMAAGSVASAAMDKNLIPQRDADKGSGVFSMCLLHKRARARTDVAT
jgi:hypothetical protein